MWWPWGLELAVTSHYENPKGLMHFGENVCHFDEVLFEGVGCSVNAFFPWLFGLILSLAVRWYREVLKLDPRYSLSLSEPVLFVEGFCNPHFGEDCVHLKAEQVQFLFYFLFQFFKMLKVYIIMYFLCAGQTLLRVWVDHWPRNHSLTSNNHVTTLRGSWEYKLVFVVFFHGVGVFFPLCAVLKKWKWYTFFGNIYFWCSKDII